MKVATIVKDRLKNLRYGKVYDYSLFDDIENRNALYATMNKLLKAKKIEKFSKGKFYKIKMLTSKFDNGYVYKFTSSLDNKSKWEQILGPDGIILGAALYNARSLTTQNPFVIEVYKPNTKRKVVKIALETIRYRNLPLAATKTNKKSIELIDIVLNKRNILDLIEKEYKNYLYNQLKTIDLKVLVKTLSKYKESDKVKFVNGLKDIKLQQVTTISNQVLKPFQRRKNGIA